MLDRIYDLLDARRLNEAGALAKELELAAEKNKWGKLLSNALELQLSMAIEQNKPDLAQLVADKLDKQPPTAYGIFLQARLLLLLKKNEQSLAKGLEAYEYARNHLDTTPQVMFEKICNLLGKLLSSYGRQDESLAFYWQAMEAGDSLELKTVEYSNYLFGLHFRTNSPQEYYKAHAGYNELFGRIRPYDHRGKYQMEAMTGQPVGKIRLGYISPDFRNHVVLRFCWVMLENYDRDRFEVFCYHNSPEEDSLSARVQDMVDNWTNISSLSAREAAEVIYKDRIDILVDLAGHTQNNPLPIMAYKPAPVQISGIGYFATTGLKTVDYFLSDRYLASEEEYFTEKIISLAHSHFCYAPLYEAPDVREAPCRRSGYITFGSFNNLRKVNDDVLELWVNILKAVPESHLLLKCHLLDDPYGHRLFCDRLLKLGVDVDSPEWKERIELRGFSLDYLGEYLDMDIALDTFPYPGGGTTCDALYMGVPVIVLRGDSHGERFGYSLLNNIGLPEFVVDSRQAYFDLAVGLAHDQEIINNLHLGLRTMMEKSSLMDRKQYMNELENAYTEVWQNYIGNLPQADCPPVSKVMQQSFDFYKEGDYPRAEGWCRVALANDRGGKYSLEGVSLLSDILQDRLDYVGAWQESKRALDLMDQEKDKGNKDFQRRLWVNYAARSYRLGFVEEAEQGYQRAAELADDPCKSFGYRGSALMASLCRTDDAEAVKEKLLGINDDFSTVRLGKASVQGKKQTRQEDGKRNGKIHLAYISPDFRQHVMFSFYYNMLHSYSRARFKVTCISLAKDKDGFTDHLKTLVDSWIDAEGMSFRELSRRLKKENIDILVDLAGHSTNSGLLLFNDRIAKVQVSGLGWMESTGMSAVDYLFTDQYIDPDLANITEKPLYLTSQFCYTGRNDVPTSQGAPVKAKGYVTFGVFNHYHKWTDEMLQAWKEILDRVPKSRLLCKNQLLVSPSARDMVLERLQKAGMDMARIELEPATNTYMNRYLDVDVALDTYPYPGGGTTCDALYMGVPVVSRYGRRRGSRFGLSILSNTGLGELAVDSLDEYIERAVGLATDVELLDVLHKNLRRMMAASPIMTGQGYMSELEKAYISILQENKDFS